MRIFIVCVIVSLFTTAIHANMASPRVESSKAGEMILQKDVDILHQQLEITYLNPDSLRFRVTYRLKAEKAGRRIPLVFDTSINYQEQPPVFFQVEMDGKLLSSAAVNTDILQRDTSLRQFVTDSLEIVRYDRLRYFQVDISEGEHTVIVEYTAIASYMNEAGVKAYYFKYNLAPARYWKSFGGMDLVVDATSPALLGYDVQILLNDNLEKIRQGKIFRSAFANLPADSISLFCQREISVPQKLLMAITPIPIGILCFLVLMGIHIKLIYKYRKKQSQKKLSRVMLIGALSIPFIVFFISFMFTKLTTWIIGIDIPEETVYRLVLFWILCLIALPFYVGLAWLIDYFIKKKLERYTDQNG